MSAAIGVFGGTFDPVHIGHLRTALEVRERLALERVLMLPSRQPPHRQPPQASAEQRLAMLDAALDGVPGLQVETCELERAGPSYMVDTLAELRQRYGASPLVLVLGVDAFVGLPGWHQWQRLFELAHILVMQRPGEHPAVPPCLQAELEQRRVTEAGALHTAPAGSILALDVAQLDISATAIRALVADGCDPRFLLAEPVRRYIADVGLYGESGSAVVDAVAAPSDERLESGALLQRLDHWVLTVADIDASIAFYRDVLGMQPIQFGESRQALRFGPHKINLHPADSAQEPRARRPQPGSADFCLVTRLRPAQLVERLLAAGVVVELGPIARSGALGPVESVYCRDPDGNLIELASYLTVA